MSASRTPKIRCPGIKVKLKMGCCHFNWNTSGPKLHITAFAVDLASKCWHIEANVPAQHGVGLIAPSQYTSHVLYSFQVFMMGIWLQILSPNPNILKKYFFFVLPVGLIYQWCRYQITYLWSTVHLFDTFRLQNDFRFKWSFLRMIFKMKIKK